MRHAYIYYRINPAQAEPAARAVDALLAMLAPQCAIPPRRLARCDEPDLWMEVYEDIFDFTYFSQHIDEATRVLGIDRYIEGERHLESFCDPLNQAHALTHQ